MSAVLVDSKVILDVLTEDPRWFTWSSAALARCAEDPARYRTHFPRLELVAPPTDTDR